MRNYKIREAVPGDLEHILKIYENARHFMAERGNPTQWGDRYPGLELLESDIQQHRLYVVVDDNIRGVFYFAFDNDPTYERIEGGAWGSEAPYGVIHRIASDGSGGIFAACLAFCKERTDYLRIDTHQDNLPMQWTVEKHGFVRRGIIYVTDGSPRIAYDLI